MDTFVIPEDAEEQFEDRGFLIVRNLITDRAIEAVRGEIERAVAGEVEWFNPDRRRSDNADLDGEDGVRAVGDPFSCRNHILWEEWLTAENVVAIIRRFVGENVRVMGSRFFTKPARFGEATPWHQDIWIWERDPTLGTREYMQRHLSIWVALDATDLENGCLHFMPGSHKGEVLDHIRYDDGIQPEIPRELLTDKPPELVPLGSGDAVAWHSHMWHMSPPNLSDHTRWGGVMIAFPDEVAEGSDHADRWFMIRNGKACPYPNG